MSEPSVRQAGRTAEGIASARAAHTLWNPEPMYRDEWALRLLSAPLRIVVGNRWLHRWLYERGQRPFRSVAAYSFACARRTEELLEAELERGVSQLVILGAGLDSHALRRPDLADRLRVFEVDHPATQALKRDRIAKHLPRLPEHLELVPADFEHETVSDALGRSRFDPTQPSVFSWLGVLPYLTREATLATLRSIVGLMEARHQLLLNYAVPPECLGPELREALAELARTAAGRGEPFRSSWRPEEFVEAVCELGYAVEEHLEPHDLEQLYFAGRSDGLRPEVGGRFARLAAPGRSRSATT